MMCMEIVKREKEKEKSWKWGSLTRAILFSQLAWFLQLVDEDKRTVILMHKAEYSATRRLVAIHVEECWRSGMRAPLLSRNRKRNFGRIRAIRNQRMHFSHQEADQVHERRCRSGDSANRTLEDPRKRCARLTL